MGDMCSELPVPATKLSNMNSSNSSFFVPPEICPTCLRILQELTGILLLQAAVTASLQTGLPSLSPADILQIALLATSILPIDLTPLLPRTLFQTVQPHPWETTPHPHLRLTRHQNQVILQLKTFLMMKILILSRPPHQPLNQLLPPTSFLHHQMPPRSLHQMKYLARALIPPLSHLLHPLPKSLACQSQTTNTPPPSPLPALNTALLPLNAPHPP